MTQTFLAAIGERFTVQRLLGRGGMGAVYLAADAEDGSQIALKTLHQIAPASLLRLKEEFRALADVIHPNLVRLHELFVDPERDDAFSCFFTMEFVQGRHLLDALNRRHLKGSSTVRDAELTDVSAEEDTVQGEFVASTAAKNWPQVPRENLATPAEIIGIFGQLAAAVQALHAQGKLHRDLKSANVLVQVDGRVVVLDFGLVQAADGQGEMTVAGTPSTMSPEQMRGLPIGPAADWFAFGVLLYEALTGRPPFVGNFGAMLYAKAQGSYPPFSPEIPEPFAALCAQLLQPDPMLRGGFAQVSALVAPQVAVGGGDGSRSLVGRTAEKAALRRAWAQVVAGEPRAVFVQGRSGIGKSALVRDLLDEIAAQPNTLVLAGRCHEREQIPHKALDAVIDALSRHLLQLPEDVVKSLVPPHAPALVRLFPVLGRHAAFATAEAIPADPRQARTLGAVALEHLLGQLAKRWHLVLAIDDLQWGDSDSAALVTRILRSENPPSLLLLGSHRDQMEQTPMLQALAALRQSGSRRVVEIALGPLNDLDARQLLQASGALVDSTLLADAAGDPYLLAEAAGSQGDHGHFHSIAELLVARLASVPLGVRSLVEVAAVAGRPTSLAILTTAPGALRSDLRQALQLRLLRLHGDATDEKVDCYHDQVRAAAHSALTQLKRRDLHLQLAHAIQADSADPEALSIHFEGGGLAAQAAHWALQAAARAERALAFRHAAELYRRYLQLAGTVDQSAQAEVRLAENLAQAGEGRAAADAFLAAAQTQASLGHALRTRAAQELMMSGHLQAGLALASEVLAVVGLRIQRSQLRAVLATLWRRFLIKRRGLEPAVGLSTPQLLQKLDTTWAMVTGFHSIDPLQASAFQTQHMLDALQAGEPRRLARSFAAEAASRSVGGQRKLAEGLALAARAQALAQQLQDPHLLALTALERGTLYFMCGHWRQAESEFSESLRLLAAHCPGAVWERATAELFLLDQYIYLGHIKRIAQTADRIVRDGTAGRNLYQLTVVMRPLHIARLAADDPQTAMREVQEAISSWPGEGRVQHFNANWALAQCELYAGQSQAALLRVKTLWPVLRWAMLLTMEYVRVEMLHLRGRALLATATGAQRERHLRLARKDASALLREVAPWAQPLGLLLRAAVHSDQPARALADLRAACAMCDEQGMALYAAAARRRIAEYTGDGVALATAFVDLDIVDPARMTAMLAPGFGRDQLPR